MFRKIPSKTRPGVTVMGELQKEFGHYTGKGSAYFRCLLTRHPFVAFCLMIASILLSGILAFTVLRKQKPLSFPKAPMGRSQPAKGLMPGTMNAYDAFKEAAGLQSRIEAIAHKDSLTMTDSTEVVNALKRIDALRQQFKTH